LIMACLFALPLALFPVLPVVPARPAALAPHPPARSLLRTPAVVCAATQKRPRKNKKTSFEDYTISGSGTLIFPLPSRKDAERVHKKHMPRGCSANKAPDTLSAMLPKLRADFPGLRIVHKDPLVLTCDNFLSDEQCNAYKALADSDAAAQVGSRTFSAATATARTSTTWFLRYQDVVELLVKATALTGEPVSHFEEPQLVRYLPGESFSWHYDAVPPTLLRNGGQRRMTLLVYLEEPISGGFTTFRDLLAGGTDDSGKPLRLQITPKRGQALLFFPSNLDGESDERTLHAGSPAKGEKWIAQLWLHQREYTPNVPDGTSQEAAQSLVNTVQS